MTLQTNASSRKIILSLVFLLALSLIAIFSIISFSISQVNQESRNAIQNHVTATIDDKLQQQATLTKDYAYWDDTIKNAYLKQDADWIDANIGTYLTETFNITDLFILTPSDMPVLTLKDGKADNSNFNTIRFEDLNSVVEQARKSGPEPVPAADLVMINGVPALMGACVLTWENQAPFPAPRPVLITAIRLDKDYLDKLSKQFRLKNIGFTTNSAVDETMSFINLKNSLELTIGKLYWTSEKPGNMVLSKIQIPLLTLLGIIILITTLIIKAFRNTELRLAHAYHELEYHANHDPLTGLANRRLFNELLVQTIHIAKRDRTHCAMLSLDLDDFKSVNDTFGHHAGDHLLVTIAKRAKECIRESDVIARVGGDEFIILLNNTGSHADIEAMAKKILTCLSQPLKTGNSEIHPSVSIGITIIPDDGIDTDELLRKADVALYRCKNRGRNTYSFYSA